MDTYCLGNEFLQAQVGDLGAELLSLRGPDGKEQIWPGDPSIWGRRGPVIFPILGGWPEGYYLKDGKQYVMDKNGFARSAVFSPLSAEKDRVKLVLRDSEESWKQYPFAFELTVQYYISGNSLHIQLSVVNTGSESMPAAVGLHPGFYWDRSQSGAYVILSQPETLQAFHPDGRYYPFLKDENRIDLTDRLFCQGAISMENIQSKWTELCRPGMDWNVRIHHEGFPYITLWSVDRQDADFVCVEPTTSVGTDGDTLEERRGIQGIPVGERMTKELILELIPKRSEENV